MRNSAVVRAYSQNVINELKRIITEVLLLNSQEIEHNIWLYSVIADALAKARMR